MKDPIKEASRLLEELFNLCNSNDIPFAGGIKFKEGLQAYSTESTSRDMRIEIMQSVVRGKYYRVAELAALCAFKQGMKGGVN